VACWLQKQAKQPHGRTGTNTMKLYTNKIELSREQLQTIINALDHEADSIAEQLQNFLNETNEEDRTAEQVKHIERKNRQHEQTHYTATAFKVVLTNLKNNFINIDNVAIEYITDGNKRYND
jgi:methyl-accepting chemotaxis protein